LRAGAGAGPYVRTSIAKARSTSWRCSSAWLFAEPVAGLALLLPHGFEGQGPEHSSARLERFMALAADDNIQLVQPTTPAQYYHALRRQVVRPLRKPLVVMTPKSLLRHPQVVSTLGELAAGRFRRILPDAAGLVPQEVGRVLMATGKVYYDLAKARAESGRRDVAILRMEQLYPLSDAAIAAALEPYRPGTPVVWVQEEPENMGAWRALRARFGETLLGRWPFSGVSREASASPATGSAKSHALEQQQLVERAFAIEVRT
jgi:2-oxoglutarate dehydrogenase E1 component